MTEHVKYLIVHAHALGFGNYTYTVTTPEEEVMNFSTKKEAKNFIKFYNDYKSKYPDRFVKRTK